MAWEVIEYMDNNPQATPKEVIGHFAEKYEVNNQISYLNQEVDKVLELREKLRPLYGKKMNTESGLAILDSDFEMEVMVKYPPRQGSDKERKAYKALLQTEHVEYQKMKTEIEQCKADIEELEYEMSDVQQRAKNARRVLETFNHLMAFVVNAAIEIARVDDFERASNVNVF